MNTPKIISNPGVSKGSNESKKVLHAKPPIKIVQRKILAQPAKTLKRKISNERAHITQRKILDDTNSKISESNAGKLVTLIRKVKTDTVEPKNVPSRPIPTHNHGTRSKVSPKTKINSTTNGNLEIKVPLKITVIKQEIIDDDEEEEEVAINEEEEEEVAINEQEEEVAINEGVTINEEVAISEEEVEEENVEEVESNGLEFTDEQIRQAEAHLYNLHCRSYGPKGLFLDPYEDLRENEENGRRNENRSDRRRRSRRESFYSSSSDDEDDAQLAEQFLELEEKYKEKEAQARLVTTAKLEALEAGIKFLGAIFTVSGLGNLKIPVKKPDLKEKVNHGEKPSTSKNKKIPQPRMKPNNPKTRRKSHSKVRNEKTNTIEDDFDLGVFHPAELTRKMKQFISQEDINPSESSKQKKCKRTITRLYQHNRRREFNVQNVEPNGRFNCNFAARNATASSNRLVARSKRMASAARFNPLDRPEGERTVKQNQQDQIQKRVLMYRQNPAARRVPNIIRKPTPNIIRKPAPNILRKQQVVVKKVEASPLPPPIDLPPLSLSNETDEERNQRLLELSNATSSQSIRHQMMRNSCIDDLFQSSLFRNNS